MAEVTNQQSPILTTTEAAARSALTAADEALRTAQEYVTKALGPVATLEQERHANGPRIASVVSEARTNVCAAQRQVKYLLQYAIPRPGFTPAGVIGPEEEQAADTGVALARGRREAALHYQQGTDGTRFA